MVRAEQQLWKRALKSGGFQSHRRGPYCPVSTTWGILVLSKLPGNAEFLSSAQEKLIESQGHDGRLSASSEHGETFWPTPLAIMAWSDPSCNEARARAVKFLLATEGRHFRSGADTPFGHDPSLKGWPWVADTHSWVEPTALAVIALTVSGYRDHPRVTEAVRMLMDRQLPHGGWNYGNTKVFGKELLPAPESTGAALHALPGHVSQGEVQRSIDYLREQVNQLRTPISLGWALLGLQSWGMAPSNMEELADACLKRQARYGEYDTASLCLLLLPVVSLTGLCPQEPTRVA